MSRVPFYELWFQWRIKIQSSRSRKALRMRRRLSVSSEKISPGYITVLRSTDVILTLIVHKSSEPYQTDSDDDSRWDPSLLSPAYSSPGGVLSSVAFGVDVIIIVVARIQR
ncbi:hypothetical protein ACFX1Z_014988 [Malus domestica]